MEESEEHLYLHLAYINMEHFLQLEDGGVNLMEVAQLEASITRAAFKWGDGVKAAEDQ